MRTSQETGTRARAGLVFQKAPSPGAFVEVFHWNYVVGSASASPASLLTNERPPSRATARPGSPRSARHSQLQAKAGARRGRRAGATPRLTWSGASRPRRFARFSSRRRTGGAGEACCFCLWRRRGLCEGLPRDWGGGRVLPASRRSFVNPHRCCAEMALTRVAEALLSRGPHPVSTSKGSRTSQRCLCRRAVLVS